MEKLRNYDILFSSLKLGKHSFKMFADQKFFDLFTFEQEFKEPKIEVDATLTKHSSFLELEIKTEGKVQLECDISDEVYVESVHNIIKILVKFGEEFDDSNEEVLIIPMGAYSVNIAQFIFESVLLSIPMKRIHPRYAEGYKDEYTDLIEKYSLPDEGDTETE
ncbi:DUF177 domain-containing protein [Apibacter raozihei]|uniref:YceD family protein n=1 Tax=Apibacter raozihei TaxID=2500547 RepID=UPI000FE2EAB6|nr:DUF177 domain-containing protein [Apibacter raozihei]